MYEGFSYILNLSFCFHCIPKIYKTISNGKIKLQTKHTHYDFNNILSTKNGERSLCNTLYNIAVVKVLLTMQKG